MSRTTFTLAEAAKLLSCHPETLRRAIQDSRLQAARIGKSYRISRSDLQTYWASMGGGVLFPNEANEDTLERQALVVDAKSAHGKQSKKNEPDLIQLSLIDQRGVTNDQRSE